MNEVGGFDRDASRAKGRETQGEIPGRRRKGEKQGDYESEIPGGSEKYCS
jgi:hypothetical protein